MARKKDSPQKAALREMMNTYLKDNNVKVKDGTDVNSIMRDMMSVILEVPSMKRLMRNWVTPGMTIGTKKRTTAGMAIPRKRCIPAMAIWNWISRVIAKGSPSRR